MSEGVSVVSELARIAREVEGIASELRRLLYGRLRSGSVYDPSDFVRVEVELHRDTSSMWDVAHLLGSVAEIDGRARIVRDALYALMDLARDVYNRVRLSYAEEMEFIAKSANVNGIEVDDEIARDFEKLSEALSRLGRRCGFVLPYARRGEVIDVSLILNDLANCVHVIAEEVSKIYAKYSEASIGSCVIYSNANPLLEELCKAWSDFVDSHSYLYEPQDRAALIGVVYDDEASFRVGSTPNHAARVRISGSSLKLEYFDNDRSVNEIMYEVLSKKCSCEIKRFGVSCRCPKTPDVARAIARALGLATSMDLRIGRYGFGHELDRAMELVWGG